MCVGERESASDTLRVCAGRRERERKKERERKREREEERERVKECVSKGSRRALPKLRKTTTTTRRRVKTAFGESV